MFRIGVMFKGFNIFFLKKAKTGWFNENHPVLAILNKPYFYYSLITSLKKLLKPRFSG